MCPELGINGVTDSYEGDVNVHVGGGGVTLTFYVPETATKFRMARTVALAGQHVNVSELTAKSDANGRVLVEGVPLEEGKQLKFNDVWPLVNG